MRKYFFLRMSMVSSYLNSLKKNICLCMFLLVLCSCFEEKKILVDGELIKGVRFENSYSIKGEKTELNPMGVSGIYVLDSFLINNIDGADYFLSVYNLNDGSFVGNYLRKGRGVGEFISASFRNQYDSSPAGRSIYIKSNQDFYSLDFDQLILHDTLCFNQKIAIPLLGFSCFCGVNDLLISKVYDIENQRFFMGFYDSLGKKKQEILLFEDVVNSRVNQLNSIDIIKSDKSKIVMAMVMFNQINIIDLVDYSKKAITISNKNTWVSEEELDMDEPVLYYSAITADDNYIYALYSNQKIRSFRKEEVNSSIHVFDWQGFPIAQLIPDQCIYSLAIDKNNTLWGLTLNEEIFKFELPNLWVFTKIKSIYYE